jgi:hypothetical protein
LALAAIDAMAESWAHLSRCSSSRCTWMSVLRHPAPERHL